MSSVFKIGTYVSLSLFHSFESLVLVKHEVNHREIRLCRKILMVVIKVAVMSSPDPLNI